MSGSSQRRGLQSLRTQATRKATNHLSSPEIYIRLTALEMERARRIMERDRLLERVRILDQRIAQISLEQAEMRYRVDQAEAQAAHGSHAGSNAANLPSGDQTSQFGFTY